MIAIRKNNWVLVIITIIVVIIFFQETQIRLEWNEPFAPKCPGIQCDLLVVDHMHVGICWPGILNMLCPCSMCVCVCVCVCVWEGLVALMCFNPLNWSALIPARNNSHGYPGLGRLHHTKARAVYLTFVSGDRCGISASIPSLAYCSRRNRKSRQREQPATRERHSHRKVQHFNVTYPGVLQSSVMSLLMVIIWPQ